MTEGNYHSCDLCGKIVPSETSDSINYRTYYIKPKGWYQYEGKHFCSLAHFQGYVMTLKPEGEEQTDLEKARDLIRPYKRPRGKTR